MHIWSCNEIFVLGELVLQKDLFLTSEIAKLLALFFLLFVFAVLCKINERWDRDDWVNFYS